MPVFADLLDLQTAVVEHVARPDIVDVFPRLVKMAEVGFSRKLRTRDQITSSTLTLASGYVELPDDFAEMIGVYDESGNEYVQQSMQTAGSDTSGTYYSVSGSPVMASGEGDISIQYYATIPTISGVMTATNWLLERHPALYLYGVGLEAAKHIRDGELIQATKMALDMEYQDIRADDESARYSRARVRVAGPTP